MYYIYEYRGKRNFILSYNYIWFCGQLFRVLHDSFSSQKGELLENWETLLHSYPKSTCINNLFETRMLKSERPSQHVSNFLSDIYVLPSNWYERSFMHENTESFDVMFYIL